MSKNVKIIAFFKNGKVDKNVTWAERCHVSPALYCKNSSLNRNNQIRASLLRNDENRTFQGAVAGPFCLPTFCRIRDPPPRG